MQELFGWPVVNAQNCFDIIRQRGICTWPQIKEQDINSYLANGTEAQKLICERFGPKVIVATHENPHTKKPFDGFKITSKPCAIVFALIEDMVPVTAEWKHGNNRITIVPIAGVPGKEEERLPTLAKKMQATALREWREETGTDLASAELLGPRDGLFFEVRKTDSCYFPFLGKVKEPIKKRPAKFDAEEHLAMVVFPLKEWVTLIETPELWDGNPDFGLEGGARDVTYAALRKLGLLGL